MVEIHATTMKSITGTYGEVQELIEINAEYDAEYEALSRS